MRCLWGEKQAPLTRNCIYMQQVNNYSVQHVRDSEGGARSVSPCGDEGSATEEEGGTESSWLKA